VSDCASSTCGCGHARRRPLFQIDFRSPDSATANLCSIVRADSQATSGLPEGSGNARPSVSLGQFAIIYFGDDWFAENRDPSPPGMAAVEAPTRSTSAVSSQLSAVS
jgi:hypothetical protein